jgi:diaminohydroxyphosphoribosylaminopyrimidine deaminase/5-amino-6-(5-phosphoribosylamino)uracil reductase
MASVFTGGARTIVCTSENAPVAWRSALEGRGAEVVSFPLDGDRVDVREVLKELGRRDVVTLLVEGGGVILGSFFDRGLVDKLHAIIAPVIVGAAEARTAISGKGAYRMAEAMRVRDITVERLGEDILITGYPTRV